jgi:hypothetical protein
MNLRSKAFRKFFFCVVMTLGVSAQAETWNWAGLGYPPGSWVSGGNWVSAGGTPGPPLSSTDFVTINSAIVNLDFNFAGFGSGIGSLAVSDSAFTINNGWQMITFGDTTNSGTAAGSDLISVSGSMIVGGNFLNQKFGTLTMTGGSLYLNTLGSFVNSGSATLNIFDSATGTQGSVSFDGGSFFNQGNATLNIVGGGLNPQSEITNNFTNSDNGQVFVRTDPATGVKGVVNAITFTNSGAGYVEVDSGASIYAASNIQNLDSSVLKIVGGLVSTGASNTTGTFVNGPNASVIVQQDALSHLTGTLGALSFLNQGSMEVDQGGYVYSTGPFTNAPGATLTANIDLSISVGSVSNQGNMILNGGSIDPTGDFVNSGSGAVTAQPLSATFGIAFSVISCAALTNKDSASITVNNLPGVLPGRFYIAVSGPITNQDSATITLNGSQLLGSYSAPGGAFVNRDHAQIFVLQDETNSFQSNFQIQGFTFTNQDHATLTVTGSTFDVGDSVSNSGGFQNLGNAIVNLQADPTTGTFSNLKVGAFGFVNRNSAQLNISGGILTTSNDVENHDNATISMAGGTIIAPNGLSNSDSGAVIVFGTPTAGSNSYIRGGINNTGTAYFGVTNSNGPAALYASGGIANGGNAQLNVTGSSLIVTDSSPFVNKNGAVFRIMEDDASATPSTVTMATSSLTNTDGAELDVIGSNLTAGTFTNQKSAKLFVSLDPKTTTASRVTVNGPLQNLDSGYVQIDSSSSLTAASYFQTGSGARTKNLGSINANITLGNPGDAAGSAGRFGGGGAVTGNLTNNAGTVAPGDPALLTVTGDFVQGPQGVLVIDVFGAGGPGIDNDELIVDGVARLGGILDIVFGNGFQPGDAFEILAANSIVGSFSTIEESFVGQQGSRFLSPEAFEFSGGIGMITTASVPEPSSFAAVLIPLVGLLGRRRA